MPAIDDLLQTSDLLAEHLRGLPVLANVEVIVNRQKDLENEISQALAPLSGAAVVVEPISGTMPDPTGKTLNFRHNYVISLWSSPILQEPNVTPASVRVVAIMKALHHWRPAPSTQPMHRMEVTGWGINSDPAYLIYAIEARLTEIV